MKTMEKIEMLIGKGVLFIIELLIAFGLFTLFCFLLNWLITTMLHNFWLTFSFVGIDILLITKELNQFEKMVEKKNRKK